MLVMHQWAELYPLLVCSLQTRGCICVWVNACVCKGEDNQQKINMICNLNHLLDDANFGDGNENRIVGRRSPNYSFN